MSYEDSSIACNFSAIADDEREQHSRTAEAVFSAIDEVREVDDGYAFRLPAENAMITNAASFVARERLCCPFFHFSLEVTPNHGPVWLTLTGRDGVKAYVEDTVLPYWNLDRETASAE